MSTGEENVYPNEKMREAYEKDFGHISPVVNILTGKRARGLQQILSDAGTFTIDDIRMAARMGVLEAARKTGIKVSVRDMEAIVDSIAKLLSKNKTK